MSNIEMIPKEETKMDNNTEIKSNEEDGIDLSNIRKTLYCVRHAQSEYNEKIRNPKTWLNTEFWYNWWDPMIHDPLLSKLGKEQVNQMSNKLDKSQFISSFGIELICVSPLMRALNTMSGILQNQLNVINDNKISIIAHHQLREWVDTLGDIGTAKSQLIETYNDNIDFSFIDKEFWWNQNIKCDKDNIDTIENVTKEKKNNVLDRISSFKHWILQREENNILVIGHSRWFREFVGAMFKLNNCGMMKVNLKGMEIESWEYLDLDKIEKDKDKINNIVKQSIDQ